VGARLKTIIKELLPPTSPENETAVAGEEAEGEEADFGKSLKFQ